MNARRLAYLARKVRQLGPQAAALDPEIMSAQEEMSRYMDDACDEAKARVTERLGEAEFVQMVHLVQSATLASMEFEGAGEFLLMDAMTKNDLRGYTHTVVFTVLGILMQEELI